VGWDIPAVSPHLAEITGFAVMLPRRFGLYAGDGIKVQRADGGIDATPREQP
jgi:hypothetical protein